MNLPAHIASEPPERYFANWQLDLSSPEQPGTMRRSDRVWDAVFPTYAAALVRPN